MQAQSLVQYDTVMAKKGASTRNYRAMRIETYSGMIKSDSRTFTMCEDRRIRKDIIMKAYKVELEIANRAARWRIMAR